MWLNYVSNGVNIQHALNGGEKKLTIGNKTYNNKTNDLILNLTPENMTQHSRIE